MPKEFLILVDDNDREIGCEEKIQAHVAGQLHRAFSIFIFNTKKELLLQQRALCKYHSPGLWTNTCCSHPRPGETTLAAASRRLMEEVGFQTILHHAGTLTYRANMPQSKLIEHEYDHVFYGFFDGEPVPNPQEVAALRWENPATLSHELHEHPERFTAWFEKTLLIATHAIEGI